MNERATYHGRVQADRTGRAQSGIAACFWFLTDFRGRHLLRFEGKGWRMKEAAARESLF